jgi:hypothetical protein
VLVIAAASAAALTWASPAAADDPCFSLGYYLDLATSTLHEIQAYLNEGNADLVSVSRDNFNHDLDVADSYRNKCQYAEPIAKYDVQRGLLLLDAAETGVYSDINAATEGYTLLADAVCNDAATYDSDALSTLKHRIMASYKRLKYDFTMPKGCG